MKFDNERMDFEAIPLYNKKITTGNIRRFSEF